MPLAKDKYYNFTKIHMIRQKRITKPPQKFISPILLPLLQQKKKIYKTNKKAQLQGSRCNYQLIPQPMKYSFPSDTRLLLGDLVLFNENGTYVSDLCLFNKFKRYKDIQVREIKKNKIIDVHIENLDVNDSNYFEERQNIPKDLKNYENSGLKEWETVVEDYFLSLESLKKGQVVNKPITPKDKKFETTVRKKTETKLAQLFDKYPCIHLKRRYKEQRLQLTQISFSESFLSLLGYSSESFINHILKEGIPPMQKSTTLDYKAVLGLMKSHFTEPDYLSHPLEYSSTVIMKCGYTRQIASKMHHLSNYEDGSFGLDTVISVISKGDPKLEESLLLNYQISKDFMKLAVLEDEEASIFSEAYYDGAKHLKYKYMDKVCKVRELDREE